RAPCEAAVENADPVAIIIGAKWVQATEPQDLRFLLGRALGRARAGLVGALKLQPDELGHFLAALLSLEVSTFQSPYPAQVLEPLARRLQKLVPKKTLRELEPYALEVAGGKFQPRLWKRAFEATALRAGLLVCADVAAAVRSALHLDGLWDQSLHSRW